MSNQAEYPEHCKLKAVRETSQGIAAFTEWLRVEKRVVPEKWATPHKLEPLNLNIRELLAEFFGLDLDEIEREERKMLAALRARDQGKMT